MRSRPGWLLFSMALLGLLAAALALRACGDEVDPLAAAPTAPRSPGRSGSTRPPPGWELETDAVKEGRARPGDERLGARDGAGDGGTSALDGGLPALAQPLLADAMRAWLRVNAEAAEKYVDEFCEESRRLKPLRDVEGKPRTRDAALYLAGRADWEDHHHGTLHLPDSLTARMADGAWRRFTPDDYAGLDFTWMQELGQFDHWTMTTAGAFREAEQVPFFEAPIPNFVTMQHWAKLRLLKGLHEGNLAQASAEVRHLAHLITTTDTVIGGLIGLALNSIERSVWEQAGQVPPTPLLSADDSQRARHLAYAQMYFLFPGVKRDVMQKALACAPLRCAALTEALGATATMRDIAPGAQEHLDWLLAQSPCSPALAQRAASSPALPASRVFDDFGGNAGVEPMMNKLRAQNPGP